MMASLRTATVPVRIVATLNGREYELVGGDLEIELAAETRALDDHLEVDLVPRNVALAMRNLLADIAGDLTNDYDLGEHVPTDQQPTIGQIVLP
jgi:hypothetical protein